jgi:two-component system, NarL family, sensor histidine kinase UhpB
MLARDPTRSNRRVLSIRGLFVVMIGTLALLALAMSGLIVFRLVASMRNNAEKELDSASRDIGSRIDGTIAGVTDVLKTLAVSDSLRRGDIETFYRQVAEVSRQVGFDFVLRNVRRGEQVFSTAPLPALPAQDHAFPPGEGAHNTSLRDTLLSGSPVLSDVFFGQYSKRNIIIDCVPVRDAGIEYALCAILNLSLFAQILKRSRLDGDWIVTVIDRNGVIIARSKAHDTFSGKKAGSFDLIKAGVPSALVRGVNAEGIPFAWAYRQMEASGWIVGVGVPQRVLDEPMRFGFGGMLIVSIVVVIGGMVLAHRASTPFARSMRELRDAVSTVQSAPESAPRAVARPPFFGETSRVLAAASAELLAVADHRQFVVSAAEVGTLQWDLVAGTAVWSERYREILGISGAVEPSLETFLARVHPSDRLTVAAAVKRHISDGEAYDREYRIVRADTGEERWVHAKARVERNRLGRPLRVLGVVMDITERKQNEHERDDLRRRLMHAQEDERLRLARELHDDTGQLLAAAMLDVKQLEPLTGAQGGALLRRLRSQLDKMSASLRRVAHELRPTSIDDLGVTKALGDHIAEWSERFGMEVDYHCLNVDLDSLPTDVGTVVFRICQEALTNIAKHATDATDIGITVDRSAHLLRLTIEDNGCGFDPPVGGQPGVQRGEGLGIAGMQERLALIGGELLIESAIGVGTTVFVRIALEATEAA